MKTSISILIFLILQITANSQNKSDLKVNCDKSLSSITYGMVHPLHEWTGTSKEVGSVILCDDKKQNITKVAVAVRISTFDSQNANRDSHVIEVTEGIKYPIINFLSTEIVPNGNTLTVKGNLTFHGITKQIAFSCEKANGNGQLIVTGSFVIKMTEFNIPPPSLMGIETEDHIDISFKTVY